jgi:hypothetical protein
MIGLELQRETHRIVDALRANTLFYRSVQATLRQYVTDKSVPLEARFQVWGPYCDKNHSAYAPTRDEFGVISKMVRDGKPCDYDRYRTYTWKDLLGYAEDFPEDVGMTVEQFMELLIETNFGSFVMDW